MQHKTTMRRLTTVTAAVGGLVASAAVAMASGAASGAAAAPGSAHRTSPSQTTTPIKHLVVIFHENVSFDHYFATYPNAANPSGEPTFRAASGTPSVNGLNSSLLSPNNPNSVQPFRLDRSQAETCDQDHSYTDEQKAFDSGLMDRFVETVGRRRPATCVDYGKGAGLVMGYYDGNTVTALWNYAQHFAMSDNSYGTTFGPSTPGAINLVSGQTHGVRARPVPQSPPNGTIVGDPQPTGDKCDTRDNTTSVDVEEQEHRRPAQREERHLGLVPGRLRRLHRFAHECRRRRRARTTSRTTSRSSTTRRRRIRSTCRRRPRA